MKNEREQRTELLKLKRRTNERVQEIKESGKRFDKIVKNILAGL